MTYYHQETNVYVNTYSPFTLLGIQYPQNWLELALPSEIAAIGLVEVVTVGTREDDRTHWVSEELSGVTRTIVNTPKDAAMVAAMRKSEVDAKLNKVREVREAMLNRMAGIALVAQIDGDTVTVDGFKAARLALLDITAGCPADPALVDEFVMLKYLTIRAALPTTLTNAFAGVDA